MNLCQRLPDGDFDFAVSELLDDPRICGKPAKFQHKSQDGDGREIILWLCAACFDTYEARFGEGAWADSSAVGNPDYMERL